MPPLLAMSLRCLVFTNPTVDISYTLFATVVRCKSLPVSSPDTYPPARLCVYSPSKR